MNKMRNNKFIMGSLFWAKVQGKQNKGFVDNSARDFLLYDKSIK